MNTSDEFLTATRTRRAGFHREDVKRRKADNGIESDGTGRAAAALHGTINVQWCFA
jgi:hypothetical protein